jgi:hypothetical protein
MKSLGLRRRNAKAEFGEIRRMGEQQMAEFTMQPIPAAHLPALFGGIGLQDRLSVSVNVGHKIDRHFLQQFQLQLGVVAGGRDQVAPEFTPPNAVGVHQIAHRNALVHTPSRILRHHGGVLGGHRRSGGQ